MIFFGTILEAMMTVIVYGSYIFVIAFTLWMAIDAGKQDRFWWMVLILGIPFVGSGVYFFTEKKHEYAKADSHHVHDKETEEQHEVTPTHHKRHKKNDIAQVLPVVVPSIEIGNEELKKEEGGASVV